MSVQNGERLATKQDLADMYQGILPYLGGMPEMVANKFSKGDLYSTEEKMIGQWINGKPLYQKVVDCSSISFNNRKQIINTGITGVDAISCYGYILTGVGTYFIPQYSTGLGDTGADVLCDMRFNGTTGELIIRVSLGQWVSAVSCYVTLQYTKTTDSAISIGSDTDYSTEEKIIGTWIDGKPVWQKTFIGNFTPSTTQRVYTELADLSSLNIDKPISCNGAVKEQNGYYKFLNVSDKGDSAVYTIVITDNKKLSILTSSTNAQTDYTITIQYTKTA